jgi:transketolase
LSDDQIARLRRRIVEVATSAGEGHVPSALSILDILWVLYGRVMGADDRFVLSKGHGCLALYAVLEYHRGHAHSVLDRFCQPGAPLLGHPSIWWAYGIEATTGSLGHGLPMAVGMALAKRIRGEPGRVFCLVGDGELEEGSCWEAIHIAARLCLSNLVVIVDDNGTSPNRIRGQRFRSDIEAKFAAFGWFVYSADGHDHTALERVFRHGVGLEPVVVVARTVKGKGIPELERDPAAWHHRTAGLADLVREMA